MLGFLYYFRRPRSLASRECGAHRQHRRQLRSRQRRVVRRRYRHRLHATAGARTVAGSCDVDRACDGKSSRGALEPSLLPTLVVALGWCTRDEHHGDPPRSTRRRDAGEPALGRPARPAIHTGSGQGRNSKNYCVSTGRSVNSQSRGVQVLNVGCTGGRCLGLGATRHAPFRATRSDARSRRCRVGARRES